MASPPDNDSPRDAPTRSVDDSAVSITETNTAGSEDPPRERTTSAIATDGLETVARARYEFFGERGRGGIGRVMVAHDARLDRRVAVKELLSSNDRSEARFVREALITARLQHPGIVPIIEAGRWEDGEPFYSMKLVEGDSLKVLISRTHDLDDRLALVPNVLAVADTIAYAHDQRVIHRDLKPSNVIVGEFGETVVIDWGMAKDLDAESDSDSETATAGASATTAGSTREGTVLGTLAYMPPEQARGESVDERADVFALGALLYHVLSGSPPLTGDTDQRLERARSGDVKPLEDRVPGVPGDLAAIVAKAMSASSDERYPTARELAIDLRRFTTGQLVEARDYSRAQLLARWLRRNRTRLVVAVLAIAMLAVGTGLTRAWYQRRSARALCGGADARTAGVWDSAVRARARAAFEATGKSYAVPTFDRVDAFLTDFSERWRDERTTACMETRHRGEQSATVMDLRMRCYDRRLAELDALTDVLSADVTDDVVLGSIDAVVGLTDVSACDDIEALSAAVPPPEDPQERQQASRLRDTVDRARAMYDVGRYADALSEVKPILADVESLGYAPLEADALYATAESQLGLDHIEAAQGTLEKVLIAAARAHDDYLIAGVRVDLMQVSRLRGKPEAALDMRPQIEVAIARADGDAALAGRFWAVIASALTDKARYPEALEAHERTLALFEQAHTDDHPNLAAALHNIGSFQRDEGNYDKALEYLERSRSMYEAVRGADHPDLARVLNTMGTVARRQNKLDEAWELTERALTLREAKLGPDHPNVGGSVDSLGRIAAYQGKTELAYELSTRAVKILEDHPDAEAAHLASAIDNLGTAAYGLGRFEEAVVHLKRSLSIMEEVRGSDHPSIAGTLSNIGVMLIQLERPGEAFPYFERAAAIQEAKLGPDHPGLGATLTGWADAAVKTGRCKEGLELARRSESILAKKLGAEHPDIAAPLSNVAASYECLGQRTRAVEVLERALALTENGSAMPDRLAGVSLQLAQVVWDIGKDRQRALELARSARTLYVDIGEGGEYGVTDVDAWLADKQ